MLHTVAIDYQEMDWRGYLQQTSIEKNGFFSSSDVGAAVLGTFGDRWGEFYGTITNGSGYTSYDNPGTVGQPVTSNRFKDFGLRLTLTPMANNPSINHYIRYLSISPWGYLGYNGSAFQSGGAGQVGPGTNGAITDGMKRNRYGVFVGLKDTLSCDFRSGGRCRLTAGFDYAQRR